VVRAFSGSNNVLWVTGLSSTYGPQGVVPTKNISIRLLLDLERARNLAAQGGVRYQAVINSLLHEALKKELKSASKQSTKSRDQFIVSVTGIVIPIARVPCEVKVISPV
jgi:hypothetical protein